MQRQELERLTREELIAHAERLGIPRPRVLTQPELIDEIIARTARNDRERARSRGWLGRARDLLAKVVERGLHLPDAARAIRTTSTPARSWPTPPPPLPTVTLAEIYAAQGHLERAVAVLDEVLAREPNHAEAKELRERFIEQSQRTRARPSRATDTQAARSDAERASGADGGPAKEGAEEKEAGAVAEAEEAQVAADAVGGAREDQAGAAQESAALAEAAQEGAVGPGEAQKGAVGPGAAQEGAVGPGEAQESAAVGGPTQESAVYAGPTQESAVYAGPTKESPVYTAPTQESAAHESAAREGATQEEQQAPAADATTAPADASAAPKEERAEVESEGVAAADESAAKDGERAAAIDARAERAEEQAASPVETEGPATLREAGISARSGGAAKEASGEEPGAPAAGTPEDLEMTYVDGGAAMLAELDASAGESAPHEEAPGAPIAAAGEAEAPASERGARRADAPEDVAGTTDAPPTLHEPMTAMEAMMFAASDEGEAEAQTRTDEAAQPPAEPAAEVAAEAVGPQTEATTPEGAPDIEAAKPGTEATTPEQAAVAAGAEAVEPMNEAATPEKEAVATETEAVPPAKEEAKATAAADVEEDAGKKEALPGQYDVDEVVAIAVDPETIYAYWEVRAVTLARALSRRPAGRLALRLAVVTPSWDGPVTRTQDVMVDALFGDRFVRDVSPGANVRVSIGWLDGAAFEPFAVGIEISSPPLSPSETTSMSVGRWTPEPQRPAGRRAEQAAQGAAPSWIPHRHDRMVAGEPAPSAISAPDAQGIASQGGAAAPLAGKGAGPAMPSGAASLGAERPAQGSDLWRAQLRRYAESYIRGGASDLTRGGASDLTRGGASDLVRGGASDLTRGGASDLVRARHA